MVMGDADETLMYFAFVDRLSGISLLVREQVLAGDVDRRGRRVDHPAADAVRLGRRGQRRGHLE